MQHFLHDRNIIQKIIYTLKPKTYDDFIEIGPGEGALTNSLIDQVDKITLIEKDKAKCERIAGMLKRTLVINIDGHDVKQLEEEKKQIEKARK